MLQATRRQANLVSWQQTIVIAEFARRRQAQFEAAKARGVPVGCRDGEFPGEELAMELVATGPYTSGRIDTAIELTTRLPLTLAGMADGLIDLGRACAIAARTQGMTDADAAYADAVLAAVAPDLRVDQLARKAEALEKKLAPEVVKARKELAKQLDQRVETRREESGNASLAGRELDTAEVIASKAYIGTLALKLRRSGLFDGPIGRLRALVLTDLTQGRDPLARITARPAPATPPAPEPTSPESAPPEPTSPGSAPPEPISPEPASPEPAAPAPASSEADPPALTSSKLASSEADQPEATLPVTVPPRAARPPAGNTPGADDAAAADVAREADDVREHDVDKGNVGKADIGGGGPSSGAPSPRGSDPGSPVPLPALINLLVPAGTLLGWGTAPAEAAGWGLLDADETRALVEAAAQHPRTRWCMTVIAPDGTAIAHGCASGQHRWSGSNPLSRGAPPTSRLNPDPPPQHVRRAPSRPNKSSDQSEPSSPSESSDPNRPGKSWDPNKPSEPDKACETSKASKPGKGQTPGQATQLLALLRRLNITLEPIARDTCNHDHEEDRYVPSRKLRHLIHARAQTCTAPACNAQAQYCDLDHTAPYPDGTTDECNLTPKCRRHHRTKQAPGWQATQPTPDTSTWTTPSGRPHTTTPTTYTI